MDRELGGLVHGITESEMTEHACVQTQPSLKHWTVNQSYQMVWFEALLGRVGFLLSIKIPCFSNTAVHLYPKEFRIVVLIVLPLLLKREKFKNTNYWLNGVHTKLLQLYLTLFDSVDYSLTGSSVHSIVQAKILAWVVMLPSRVSSQPWDQTHVSCISCTGRHILYH